MDLKQSTLPKQCTASRPICLQQLPESPWIHYLLSQSQMSTGRRALWEQLFSDKTQFDDLRQYKAQHGGQNPDFKHKETGEGLW